VEVTQIRTERVTFVFILFLNVSTDSDLKLADIVYVKDGIRITINYQLFIINNSIAHQTWPLVGWQLLITPHYFLHTLSLYENRQMGIFKHSRFSFFIILHYYQEENVQHQHTALCK